MNKKNDFYLLIIISLILFTFNCKKQKEEPQVITDADLNEYTSATIGSQVWMVENLQTTKYNDGTAITNVSVIQDWCALTTGAYRWSDNDISYKTPYGALYNWYAVNTGKLCPVGWHVPNNTDWTTLINSLGGENTAAAKMKESGTTHWWPANSEATNQSGFTALPGGFTHCLYGLPSLGLKAAFWSSTENDASSANNLTLWYEDNNIGFGPIDKYTGNSVRCIKNQTE